MSASSTSALNQWVKGTLLADERRAVLLMDQLTGVVCLRYALVERNSGKLVFPEMLLDDWGKEISSLKLYGWLQKNAVRFPRAEVFGFYLNGKPAQYFVRDLDLMARYPCYAYINDEVILSEGTPVEAVLLPDNGVSQPQRVSRPPLIGQPMQQAQVSWWLVKPDGATSFDFALLGDPIG